MDTEPPPMDEEVVEPVSQEPAISAAGHALAGADAAVDSAPEPEAVEVPEHEPQTEIVEQPPTIVLEPAPAASESHTDDHVAPPAEAAESAPGSASHEPAHATESTATPAPTPAAEPEVVAVAAPADAPAPAEATAAHAAAPSSTAAPADATTIATPPADPLPSTAATTTAATTTAATGHESAASHTPSASASEPTPTPTTTTTATTTATTTTATTTTTTTTAAPVPAASSTSAAAQAPADSSPTPQATPTPVATPASAPSAPASAHPSLSDYPLGTTPATPMPTPVSALPPSAALSAPLAPAASIAQSEPPSRTTSLDAPSLQAAPAPAAADAPTPTAAAATVTPAASAAAATTTTSTTSTTAAAAAPAPVPSSPTSPISPALSPSFTVGDGAASAGRGPAASLAVEQDYGLEITVGAAERIGSGMSSYITYAVKTKSSLQGFRNAETAVKHRYSDFFALFKHLETQYPGLIVPPPPPKDAIGTGLAKLKSGGESSDFVERRGHALSRFMRRIARHPVLHGDPLLRAFLESSDKFAGSDKAPKAENTLLAAAAGKRMSATEANEWFETKAKEVDHLEAQLKKLHIMADSLVHRRKELSASINAFVESLSGLAAVEDVQALGKALHTLADAEAKIAKLQQQQANAEFFDFCEIINDYFSLIGAIRTCFAQRQQAQRAWQNAEVALVRKKEAETKALTAGKPEKREQAQKEVLEGEAQVQATKKALEEITLSLREELERFEQIKVTELKQMMVQYVETIIAMEQQVVRAWEQFLPDAHNVMG